RLSCKWPEAVPHLQLPPLLLIMLVENAFKHGVETSADDCHVHIELTLLSGRLHFLCSNTLNEAAADNWTMQGAGVGLENLRRRLQLLYGNRFVLRSEPQQ